MGRWLVVAFVAPACGGPAVVPPAEPPEAPPPISAPTLSASTAEVRFLTPGTAITPVTLATTGLEVSLSLAEGAPPPGLSFDPARGTLHGAPTGEVDLDTTLRFEARNDAGVASATVRLVGTGIAARPTAQTIYFCRHQPMNCGFSNEATRRERPQPYRSVAAVGDVIAWEATTAGDFWYVGVRAVRPVDAFPPRTLPNEPNAVRRLGLNAPGLIVYDDISLLHDGRGELTVR